MIHMNQKIIFAAVVVAATAAVFLLAPSPSNPPGSQKPPNKTSSSPVSKATLLKGGVLFFQNCMVCHGKDAMGSDNGPPLVHRTYEPNHHADSAFYLAVARGVRQHHWKFGDMMPLPKVKREDVAHIIRYVRDLQKNAGIF